MKRFEVIEHTADAGLVAYGGDLKEAFANAAYGMFSLIAEPEKAEEKVSREVEVAAQDEEGLLVSWLNELIYLFDVEKLFFKRFEVVELDSNRLRARAYGEPFHPQRHGAKTAIKAATYHMVGVERGKGFKVRVIFDL